MKGTFLSLILFLLTIKCLKAKDCILYRTATINCYDDQYKHGHWKYFYQNDTSKFVTAEGSYSHNIKSGEWTIYYVASDYYTEMRSEYYYVDGSVMLTTANKSGSAYISKDSSLIVFYNRNYLTGKYLVAWRQKDMSYKCEVYLNRYQVKPQTVHCNDIAALVKQCQHHALFDSVKNFNDSSVLQY